MQIIDLTHSISEEMPVYPGTEGPKLRPGSSYEQDGFRETILTMYSHTGTHMDAPNHLYPKGTMLDALPISHFWGSGVVIDCSMKKTGELITMEDLASDWEAVKSADYLLFHTGWSRFWGREEYFGDYPCLDFAVVDYLIEGRKKGVGLDVIGLDPISDIQLSRHRQLLHDRDVVIIENLTNLDQIGRGLFTFIALPLKFKDADGAPVRAIAVREK
jgi:kynurenine formamidase